MAFSQPTNNILFLTNLFPPAVGGVQNYYRNILFERQRLKHYVVTNSSKVSNRGYLEEVQGKNCIIRSHFFPANNDISLSLNWFSLFFSSLLKTILFVRKKRIDALIVGQANFFVLALAFIVRHIFLIPYAVILHGEEIPSLKMKSNFLIKLFYKHAKLIICNSNYTLSRFKTFVGMFKKRCFVIYPGVEDRFFSAKDEKAILGLKSKLFLDSKRIIYTYSRLDERKGIDKVVEALLLIIQKFPNVVYLVGGEGPYLSVLKETVERYGLKDFVRFLGFIPESELVLYHRLGEVFVMPNRILPNGDAEGFGMVFLEANAVGNPVVGGKYGGSAEAIEDGETGFLVDPFSLNDIADKICLLLENDNLRINLGEKGKIRARNQFNWNAAAIQYESAIEAINESK